MPTQQAIADHLFMSERNVRDVLAQIADRLGFEPAQPAWWQDVSMDLIRRGYIEHQRDMAAGRGGDSQGALAQAKTEESVVKTAMLRLDYNRNIKLAIYAYDVAGVLNDWARYANREYTQGVHKIVSEIESAHEIEIDRALVVKIASATTERIKDHAAKLGRDIVEGIESVSDAESGPNSAMDL